MLESLGSQGGGLDEINQTIDSDLCFVTESNQ